LPFTAGGSLFGVSAIKLVAIGDQLSTFEFGLR
jgi:hypothetical protein